MEKLVYVVWRQPDSAGAAYAAGLVGETATRLVDLGCRGLSINVADADVDYAKGMRLTRFDPPVAAVVSFWLEMAELRPPFEAALARGADAIAGYLVVESVPLANTTHSADLGARTPGTNIVSCIERPERLDHAQWLEHWHGHHKEVALETQCIYEYVRNEVVRPLTADAPPWQAIVEEGFPADAVTDPMVWYCADGSKEKLEANFARMMESVQAFLDVDRVESNPLSQYRMQEL